MKKDDLNKKQRYALDTMLSGSNVFLTGDAGTGQSYIKAFSKDNERLLEQSFEVEEGA